MFIGIKGYTQNCIWEKENQGWFRPGADKNDSHWSVHSVCDSACGEVPSVCGEARGTKVTSLAKKSQRQTWSSTQLPIHEMNWVCFLPPFHPGNGGQEFSHQADALTSQGYSRVPALSSSRAHSRIQAGLEERGHLLRVICRSQGGSRKEMYFPKEE